ncbi:beta-N-acetylhexosaminidase [Robinsoniella peoriensis]|uniref:beta-N-acetylhexosaminidase n=1 Tax=Robinsoniella peoriensis TaxID=180332 RepID=UPI000B04617B|nr:glycoside hydrolase family 20 zincin-like fold domain-containing protein [Robinsoniella peoriensis]
MESMYILPAPQKIMKKEGAFALPHYGKIEMDASCPQDVSYAADILKREILDFTGMDYSLSRGTKGTNGGAEIVLKLEDSLKEQSYVLVIREEGIQITGGGYHGILYGIQTLRQIIRQEGCVLPLVEIEDEPAMEFRGFYHDVTRGRIPKLETLKKLADTLSFYKINQLQLYVEHSFLFEGLSEMWRDDTPLTPEDILELDAHCRKAGVELVPSLSSFGHLYKLLSTRTYEHLCELADPVKMPFSFRGRQMHHTLNVTMEESYELAVKMIEEYMPLFTSKQFNIGADETFDLGKGKSKTYAEEAGIDRMYIDYVKKLCGYLVDKGYRPMFWGDVICGFPELMKELPKETICLNWGYAWNQCEDGTKALAEAGATQYVCPGAGGWNQFINLMESAYMNISRMCAFGEKYRAIGMLNTDWGDFGHINHPDFSMPGMIYGAAFSWNRKEISFEEINRMISVLQYQDRSERLMSVVSRMCRHAVFDWEMAVRFQELTESGIEDTWCMERIKSREKEILKAEEENKILKSEELELKKCAKEMNAGQKKAVHDFLIAAEGIAVLNSMGLLIYKSSFQGMAGCADQAKVIAQKLECWFCEYKKMWRSISRESELYRVSHVIFWFADFLRDMK